MANNGACVLIRTVRIPPRRTVFHATRSLLPGTWQLHIQNRYKSTGNILHMESMQHPELLCCGENIQPSSASLGSEK